MSGFRVGAIVGIALALSLVAGALISGGRRPEGPQGSLAQACVGRGNDRELANALGAMRGQSNGGSDPLCEAIAAQVATAGPLRGRAIVAAQPRAHQPMP